MMKLHLEPVKVRIYYFEQAAANSPNGLILGHDGLLHTYIGDMRSHNAAED